MEISNVPPVGVGNVSTPNTAASQPTSGADATPKVESTTTTSSSTTFISSLPSDSSTGPTIEKLIGLALALWILDILTANGSDKEEDSNQVMLAAGLAGMLENRDQQSVFFASHQSETTSLSVVDTQAVVAAYSQNEEMPAQAPDPSASTQPTQVPEVDTQA